MCNLLLASAEKRPGFTEMCDLKHGLGALWADEAVLAGKAVAAPYYRFLSVALALLPRTAFAATVGFEALAGPRERAAVFVRRTPG